MVVGTCPLGRPPFAAVGLNELRVELVRLALDERFAQVADKLAVPRYSSSVVAGSAHAVSGFGAHNTRRQIRTAEKVATGAFGLTCVDGNEVESAHRVDRWGHLFEVFDLDALAVAAQVVEVHRRVRLAVDEEVGDAVGAQLSSGVPKESVALVVELALPFVATGLLVDEDVGLEAGDVASDEGWDVLSVCM